MNNQYHLLVAGPKSSGKEKILSSLLDIPIEQFNNALPFFEVSKNNIPVIFIDANPGSKDELERELDSERLKPNLCWYILPGDIQSINQKDKEIIECLYDYFDTIVFVITNVDNMESSVYNNLISEIVENPSIIKLPRFDDRSVLTEESALSQLIDNTFIYIEPEYQSNWQTLINMRKATIYHNVETKPETIDFDGITLAVQDQEIGHLNIVVGGISGVGKSTLINAIYGDDICPSGVGKSVSKEIIPYDLPGKPITIFDTPGFELGESDNLQNLLNLIKRRRSSPNPSDHIHILWYCIKETSHRNQAIDIHTIKEVAKLIPVFVVYTLAIDPYAAVENQMKVILNAATYDDFLELEYRNARKIEFKKLTKSNIAIHRIISKDFESAAGVIHARGLKEFIKLHEYYLYKVSSHILNTSQVNDIEAYASAAHQFLGQFILNSGIPKNVVIYEESLNKFAPIITDLLIGICRAFNLPIEKGELAELALILPKESDIKEGILSLGSIVLGVVGKVIPFLSGVTPTIESVLQSLLRRSGKDALLTIGNIFIDVLTDLSNSKVQLSITNILRVYKERMEEGA
ncbi:GTP-binding protein [Histomonas meleagridis]|uniref:GTP-binding protein n=1 Tax=Histomonas meleagridis TaxID=135588 RepID=UPI00355A0B23|nr:GTP-binding protein [Histomonas meleagridis]KAH0805426.1 GTP-binding protein [Histomonas meleagridis]